MGYVYLSLALFAGVAKGFFGKTISRDVSGFRDCTYINALRMLFCAAVGLVLTVVAGDAAFLHLNADNVWIYLLSSVSMAAFCLCWMYAYKQDAYVFLNTFTMLGSVVTCFLSFLVFDEPIRWNEWVGMALLLAAVLIMMKYNKELKGRIRWLGVLLLIVGCLGAALSDFAQKLYMRQVGESASCFTFYTYAFGLVFVLLLYGLTYTKKNAIALSVPIRQKANILSCLAMSLFLFINTSLKTVAAGMLTAAQIYPVLQGSNLLLSGLMAHFIFREKSNLKSVVGMIVAFVGLLLMNML